MSVRERDIQRAIRQKEGEIMILKHKIKEGRPGPKKEKKIDALAVLLSELEELESSLPDVNPLKRVRR